MKRIEFTVSWPIQGVAAFRARETELVLSNVYWMWILEALRESCDGEPVPFMEAFDGGFDDPSNLVEALPVTPRLLEVLGKVPPSSAPSFELLVPSEACAVPTPDQLLEAFVAVARDALSSGTMEIEIE